MPNKDLRVGLGLLVIFLILFGISFTIPQSAVLKTHTSPAFFPRTVLIVAIGLTLLLIVKALLQGKPLTRGKALERQQKVRVLGTFGLAAFFPVGAIYLGTFVSMFILIVVLMTLWGVKNKMAILLNAALTPVLIYLIFTELLMVQFPSGVLF
jgi:putative tricarboxylic transport membrane protein